MQTQGLFTVKELSSYLGVSPCTVRRWVKNQDIPFIKRKGLGIRFVREEVEAWLSQAAHKPDAVLDIALTTDLTLEKYDKLFLKGGVKMSPKGKTWIYPFGSVYLRLTKTGEERWYIYYRNEGRRVRKAVKGAQCRADALKVLQVEVADVFRGKHGFKRDEKRIGFFEFCQLYIENYAKVNKRSWRDDVSAVGSFKPYFGKVWLHTLGVLDIENFKSARLASGVSKARVNRNLTVLKKMLNLAVDWGYLQENPSRKVKRFPEAADTEMRFLTLGDKGKLLEACAPHLRPIVLTALLTGMRRGEILGLQWRQVDLLKRTIRVERTKNGKTRVIPINSLLFEELSMWQKQTGQSEVVFPDPRTKKPIRSVKTSFRTACKAANILGLRFHDLRHTAASDMIRAGVPVPTVQRILGHSSILMTMRYVHVLPEDMRIAVETLVPSGGLPPPVVPTVSKREESDSSNSMIAVN